MSSRPGATWGRTGRVVAFPANRCMQRPDEGTAVRATMQQDSYSSRGLVGSLSSSHCTEVRLASFLFKLIERFKSFARDFHHCVFDHY